MKPLSLNQSKQSDLCQHMSTCLFMQLSILQLNLLAPRLLWVNANQKVIANNGFLLMTFKEMKTEERA